MGDKTKIEWCDATINPYGWGCYGPDGTPAEPARCYYCYAWTMARRNVRDCPRCREFVPHDDHLETELAKLARWKRGRRVFVQSMGDPCGCGVEREWISRVLDEIEQHPQHDFIMLTKNPERARWCLFERDVERGPNGYDDGPIPNLWLGTSAEGQPELDWRVEHLLNIPAACHVLSLEPYLQQVSVRQWVDPRLGGDEGRLGWVIVGGKTGADPWKPPERWVRRVVVDCRHYGVPVFIKDNVGYPETIREFPALRKVAV